MGGEEGRGGVVQQYTREKSNNIHMEREREKKCMSDSLEIDIFYFDLSNIA